MSMLGLWLENKTLTLRRDLPKPVAQKDEALIKILKAGVCNTDIELTKGYYPYAGVLGHEFVGLVEEGPQELRGKRVVGELNIACNHCQNCAIGLKNHCYNRSVLGIVNKNGVFAEYITLPIANLHPVPDEVSTAEATFTEPLAAALEIQQQIQIAPTDKVLVIGDGKLGLLIAQTLLLNGCELWLIGHHEKKFKLLQQRGAIVGTEEIIPQQSYFDTAIECTGNPLGFNLALKALKPRGTLVMKSTYAGSLSIDAAAIVVNEIKMIGSRCGPFQPALRLLAKKLINTEFLIEQEYPLREGLQAFEHAKRKGALKILVTSSQ